MQERNFLSKIKTLNERLEKLQEHIKTGSHGSETRLKSIATPDIRMEVFRVIEKQMRHQEREAKIARQLLELEQQKYHDLFNVAPDGYIVTDGKGVIQMVNATAPIILTVGRGGSASTTSEKRSGGN